jgi:hypothetical protein
VDAFVISYSRRAAFAPRKREQGPGRSGWQVQYLDNTWAPVQRDENMQKKPQRENTDHTSKPLLSCSVPELETNLDAVDMDLLCDEKGAAGRSGVLGVELVLSVALEEGGFAYTRVAHDDDFGVDAMVEAGDDVGVHGWRTTARESGATISPSSL